MLTSFEQQYQGIKELANYFAELRTQVNLDATSTKSLKLFTPNVLVEHSETEKVPIVWENEPTQENLFGKLRETLKDPNSTWQQYDHQNFESGSLIKYTSVRIRLHSAELMVGS